MITILGHSSINLKLLYFFFSALKPRFYLRELSRQLKHPAGSLQRPLRQLEEEGILESSKEGPLKFFTLNEHYPYFLELKSVILRERRRRALEKDLKKLMTRLRKSYKPQKVILFGSLASGRVSPDGDLDLLIVKKNVPQRYWDRLKEMVPLVKDCQVGVDFVIWKPEELEREMDRNFFLRDEILKKGKILYERAA